MRKILNLRTVITHFTVLNLVSGNLGVQSYKRISQMAMPTVNASGKPTGLLIFLHGLGDTGDGWCSHFQALRQKNVKYICPTAEVMPVSLNYGMKMPSWFDIKSLDMSANEDEAGIQKSAERIRALIKQEQEANGIPSNKIMLGGFSMGGALALYTSLTHEEPLGGLILLSSWLPLHKKFAEKIYSLTNQTCPIFQGHGADDPLVNYSFGQMSYKILSEARKKAWELEPKIEFKTYKNLGHSSSEEEMRDVVQFIKTHLS